MIRHGMRIVSTLGIVVLTAVTAFAEPLDGSCPLTTAEADAAIKAFEPIKKVLRHPRCVNCHGVVNDLHVNPNTEHLGGHIPLDDKGQPKQPCIKCHEQAGDVWELAPVEQLFAKKSDVELCVQLKVHKRMGVRLLNHVMTDRRILLGFDGTRGQDLEPEPPSIEKVDGKPVALPHEDFVKMVETWLTAMYRTDDVDKWGDEYPGGSDTTCGCETVTGSAPVDYDQRAVAALIHAADSTATLSPEQVTAEIKADYIFPDENDPDAKYYRLSFGEVTQWGDQSGHYEIAKIPKGPQAPTGWGQLREDRATGVITWIQRDLKQGDGVTTTGLVEVCAEKRFKQVQASVCRRKPIDGDLAALEKATAEVVDEVEEKQRTLLDNGRTYDLFGDEPTAETGKMAECGKGAPVATVPGTSAEKKELHRRVRAWRIGEDPDRPGQELPIDDLPMEKLQALVPVAQGVGHASGMDRERIIALDQRLTEIWNVVRKGIRGREFRDTKEFNPPNFKGYGPRVVAPPPKPIEEEVTAERQAYRVRLYKRITLAYLDALFSAQETIPACCLPPDPKDTIEIHGQKFPKLGCQDPVIDGLVSYGKAIQEIGSAEDELLRADYELLIQKQQLVTDFLSMVPLVGDAMDVHYWLTEEDLAGNCLTRFENGLMPIMMALPFVGPSMVKAALQRSPRAKAAVERMGVWMEELSVRYADATQAIANRWNKTPAEVDAIKHALKEANPLPHPLARELNDVLENIASFTDDEIRLMNPQRLKDPAQIDVKKARETLKADAVIENNMRLASENKIWIKAMPPELRERALARSKKILEENLDKLQLDRDAVVKASHMVREHLDAIESKVVKGSEPKVLVFRFVEGDATTLIEKHFSTKNMSVKGKSSNWGPQAGLIPVDQKFSKLGNPKKALDGHEAEKILKFQDEVTKCLASNICHTTKAMRDGNKVMVIPDASGKEIPVLQKPDGTFLDPDTMKPMADIDASKATHMEVLADANGNPLTADYDFLAFGLPGQHSSPSFNANTGFITKKQEEVLAAVNDAVKESGYRGGNISHHGAETFYPGSPGALKVDPVVTAIDPKRGLVTIPRCDLQCMEQWCRTTRACGGLPICGPDPKPPCVPIDPDRLLKDYFHAARLEGYNLDPNPVWNWGSYNVMGGWTMRGYLEEGIIGQISSGRLTQASRELANSARRAIVTGVSQGAKYLFECAPRADGTIPERRE